MARYTFGGGTADWLYVLDDDGDTQPAPEGTTVTFWDSISDGAQYVADTGDGTGLVDGTGTGIDSIATDANGRIPDASVQGPDGVTRMAADASGGAGPRSWVWPSDPAGLALDAQQQAATALATATQALNAVGGGSGAVTSVNGRTGVVVVNLAQLAGVPVDAAYSTDPGSPRIKITNSYTLDSSTSSDMLEVNSECADGTSRLTGRLNEAGNYRGMAAYGWDSPLRVWAYQGSGGQTGNLIEAQDSTRSYNLFAVDPNGSVVIKGVTTAVAAILTPGQDLPAGAPAPMLVVRTPAPTPIASFDGTGVSDGTTLTTSVGGTADTKWTSLIGASAFTVDAVTDLGPWIKLVQASGEKASVEWNATTIGALTTYAVRCYVQLTAHPSASWTLVGGFGTGGSVKINVAGSGGSAGQLRLVVGSGSGTQVGSSDGTTMATGTAYRVELLCNAGSATVNLYEGDSYTPIATFTGDASSVTPDHWDFGPSSATPTLAEMRIGHIAIAESALPLGPAGVPTGSCTAAVWDGSQEIPLAS